MVEKIKIIIHKAKTLLMRRNAYRRVFSGKDGEIVLCDLRRFCPTDPTLESSILNEKQILINIGKRQVLSRISAMINMSEEKINALVKAEAKEIDNGEW